MTRANYLCWGCDIHWRAGYGLFTGYTSKCPKCGTMTEALCDVAARADRRRKHRDSDHGSSSHDGDSYGEGGLGAGEA
jgi:hypothetical protein